MAKISDYSKEQKKENRFISIDRTNLENGFNVYKTKDGYPFFNLLATRIFPNELEPYSYKNHTVKEGETLHNIAYQYYKNIKLWWVIAEANHIQNPFDAMTAGLVLKVPNDNTISDIMTEMANGLGEL